MPSVYVVLLFVLGILLIVKGGDLFVDAAAWISEVLGIPKVIVGATIVSLATTLPEIIVSLLAAAQAKPEIAVGNAVGSVTANLGLIMSICALFNPFIIKRKDFTVKGALMLLAIFSLFVFSSGGYLSHAGSFILFIIFAFFVYENINSAKSCYDPPDTGKPSIKEVLINMLKFTAGTAGIITGAQLLVNNGTKLAEILGVPESIIAVTFVAIGTSLPELVTTVSSVVKKQGALSVGNIIGANIIDTTLIIPLCGVIAGKPALIVRQSITLDMPFCLLIGAAAIIPMLFCSKLMRWQGVLMFLLYCAYIYLIV